MKKASDLQTALLASLDQKSPPPEPPRLSSVPRKPAPKVLPQFGPLRRLQCHAAPPDVAKLDAIDVYLKERGYRLTDSLLLRVILTRCPIDEHLLEAAEKVRSTHRKRS